MGAPELRAMTGAGLALGAPLGWMAIRWLAAGRPPHEELADAPGLYAYLLGGTMAAFSGFGFALGSVEERLAESNRRLERQAPIDELTGLENQRALATTLPRMVARAHRGGGSLGLLIARFDDLALYAGRWGADAGQDLERRAARALVDRFRTGDHVCRSGPGEFTIALPGVPPAGARGAAERALATLRGLRWDGHGEAPTASLGLAHLRDAEDASTLVLRAAEAAADARRRGGDRVAETDETREADASIERMP